MNKLVTANDQIQLNPALSPRSVAAYTQAYKHYRQFLSGSQETPQNVSTFFKSIGDKFRPNYFNLIRSVVKTHLLKKYQGDIVAQAHIKEVFKTFRKQRTQAAIGADKYYSETEMLDIASKLSPRLALLWQFAWQSGLRISEILSVRKDDVKIQRGVVEIFVRQAKGNKEYRTYCTVELLQKIKKVFRAESGLLFSTRTGRPVDRRNIDKELKRIGRQHGYELSMHKCRHSRAMYLRDKGLDPRQVAFAMNHSNVETTLRFYYHSGVTPTDLGVADMTTI